MVLVAFLWSGAFIAGKYTGPYIPSGSVTMMRFAISTVLIYFIMKWTQAREPETAYRFDRKEHSPLSFYGNCGYGGISPLFL